MAQITNPDDLLYDVKPVPADSLYDNLYLNKETVDMYAGKLFYMSNSGRSITPSIVFHPNNIVSFKHAKAIYYLKSIEVMDNQVVATLINSRDGETEYKRVFKNKKDPFSHTFRFINFNTIKDITLKNYVYTHTKKNIVTPNMFLTDNSIVVVNNNYESNLIDSRKFMDTYVSTMFNEIKKPDMTYINNQLKNISSKVLKGNTNPQSGMVLVHDGTTSWDFIDPPYGIPILKAKKSKTKKIILVKENELVLPNQKMIATSDDRTMKNMTDFTFNLIPNAYVDDDKIVILKKKKKRSPQRIVIPETITLGQNDYNIYRSPGVFVKEIDITVGTGAPVLEFDNFRPNKLPK